MYGYNMIIEINKTILSLNILLFIPNGVESADRTIV
jgi:hypothetical protein